MKTSPPDKTRMMIASNPPCLKASSISPNVKAQIRRPSRLTGCDRALLIFRLVPMRDPEDSLASGMGAEGDDRCEVNTAANIGPRNGEVK